MITGKEAAMPLGIVDGRSGETTVKNQGLTIRQHFAAMAMQALYSNNLMVDRFGCGETVAEEAVKLADALIAELNKTTTP